MGAINNEKKKMESEVACDSCHLLALIIMCIVLLLLLYFLFFVRYDQKYYSTACQFSTNIIIEHTNTSMCDISSVSLLLDEKKKNPLFIYLKRLKQLINILQV